MVILIQWVCVESRFFDTTMTTRAYGKGCHQEGCLMNVPDSTSILRRTVQFVTKKKKTDSYVAVGKPGNHCRRRVSSKHR